MAWSKVLETKTYATLYYYIIMVQMPQMCYWPMKYQTDILNVLLALFMLNLLALVRVYFLQLSHEHSACSGSIATKESPASDIHPTFIEWLRNAIGNTIYSMHLSSLDHCINIMAMKNIRPDRDSSSGLEQQITKWAIIADGLPLSRRCSIIGHMCTEETAPAAQQS